VTINGVSFTGNNSPNGSALYLAGSDLTVTNSTCSRSTGAGGAIAHDTLTANSLSLSSSTVSGNYAFGVRPATLNCDPGAMTVELRFDGRSYIQ
jgi:hypothetical protein